MTKEAGVDIGRSVQYIFQDPQWIKKVLIGGILFIIPIIGWLIIGGYYLRLVRDVSRGQEALPEWDEWGDDLVRGLKTFVVYLVYSLPLILLYCVFGAAAGVEEMVAGTSGFAIIMNCISFLYSIALYFVTPLFIGRLAMNEQIPDAFQFGDIAAEAQRIPAQLLIYVVIAYVASFVAGFGLVLCIIGVLFTSFIAQLVTGHLIGQIRQMLGGGEPGTQAGAPTAPPPAV